MKALHVTIQAPSVVRVAIRAYMFSAVLTVHNGQKKRAVSQIAPNQRATLSLTAHLLSFPWIQYKHSNQPRPFA